MMITKLPVQKPRPWTYAVLGRSVISVSHTSTGCNSALEHALALNAPKTKLACAGLKDLEKSACYCMRGRGSSPRQLCTYNMVLAVDLGQLARNILRAVRGRVVDNNDLPVEVAGG